MSYEVRNTLDVHSPLSALKWFQKNGTLSETGLSMGTFSIRIKVNRSNMHSQVMLRS